MMIEHPRSPQRLLRRVLQSQTRAAAATPSPLALRRARGHATPSLRYAVLSAADRADRRAGIKPLWLAAPAWLLAPLGFAAGLGLLPAAVVAALAYAFACAAIGALMRTRRRAARGEAALAARFDALTQCTAGWNEAHRKQWEHIGELLAQLLPLLTAGVACGALPTDAPHEVRAAVERHLPEAIERHCAVPATQRAARTTAGHCADNLLLAQLAAIAQRLAQLHAAWTTAQLAGAARKVRFLEGKLTH